MSVETKNKSDSPGVVAPVPVLTGQPQRESDGSVFGVLKRRNFLLYWLGQFISLVGTWMQQLAFNWVVLSLTNSAFTLGMVTFCGALPPAILLLYGGTIADRFDKRQILIVSQFVFMIGAFFLAWLVWRGNVHMWQVLLVAIVMGVAQAFDMPASQSLVPELVERKEIGAAVQLNQAIFHGSRFIGPTLAGWLIARYGTFAGFMANGISFLPVIATLFAIRSLRSLPPRPKENAWVAMGAGLSYTREHSYLFALMGITALTTTLVFPNMAVLMPYFVKNVLHQNANVVGTMMGVSGLGAFAGAMSLLFIKREQRLRCIILGMTGIVVAMLTMATAATATHLGYVGNVAGNLLLAYIGAIILGVSISSSLGMVNSVIQQSVPDDIRGRVTSLQTLVFIGIMPFSSLLMTKVVDIISMPHELFVAAIGYGVGAICLFTQLNSAATREALHGSPSQ